MQRPWRRTSGARALWTITLLIALASSAVACAPSEESDDGAAAPGTTTGTGGAPQLDDDFSVQNANWANETVDTARFKKDPP